MANTLTTTIPSRRLKTCPCPPSYLLANRSQSAHTRKPMIRSSQRHKTTMDIEKGSRIGVVAFQPSTCRPSRA